MKILAFDTSMSACSAALYDSASRKCWQRYEELNRGHAERLIPMIAEILSDAKMSVKELDRLAVTTGPGTFTGVRIGIAAARGLAVAAGLPLTGTTSLAVMAQKVKTSTELSEEKKNDPLVIATDARRGEIYLQIFDAQANPTNKATACTPHNALTILAATGAEKINVAGSGGQFLSEAAHDIGFEITTIEPNLLPRAATLAAMAVDLPLKTTPLKPLYLRAPDAKPQTNKIVSRQ